MISHGDMGVVYRAEELALQRPVALKLILPEYSSDERFRERFRRESKIAAAIDHPNVIPVFDAGDEGGVLYISMRLVEGTDLRALIDAEGQIDPLRAARIVRQVGAALDAAHTRGMLHRDIKPSNVLIARRDHVYLTDFGLAKQASADDGLTRGQTIVARAEYVAPEQVLGQRVDARADIYALGCLLFEALTGEPPFAGWTGGPRALAHLDAPRPTPSDLRPDLPRAFDAVVQRAMATDPARAISVGRRSCAGGAGGRRRPATHWSRVDRRHRRGGSRLRSAGDGVGAWWRSSGTGDRSFGRARRAPLGDRGPRLSGRCGGDGRSAARDLHPLNRHRRSARVRSHAGGVNTHSGCSLFTPRVRSCAGRRSPGSRAERQADLNDLSVTYGINARSTGCARQLRVNEDGCRSPVRTWERDGVAGHRTGRAGVRAARAGTVRRSRTHNPTRWAILVQWPSIRVLGGVFKRLAATAATATATATGLRGFAIASVAALNASAGLVLYTSTSSAATSV